MTEISWILLAISTCLALVNGLLIRSLSKNQKQIEEINKQLTQAKIQEARALEAAELATTHKSGLEESISRLSEDLRKLENDKIEAETRYDSVQTALESEKETLKEAKVKLSETFKSLAADVLKGNNEQFLELAQSHFEKDRLTAKGDLEKRKQAIDALVSPLKETLNKYQNQIGDIEKERQKSYYTVEAELKKVIESNSNLARQTRALKDALKKPHIRGRWGEVQLKNCIELAGMSEYADVSFQDHHVLEEGKRLIPDMTVRMPGGRIVVVDCKTPLEAFISSLEATDEETRETEMIRHGRHVKEHVQKLASKDYAANIEESADFTVMFLPNESFLYAALESEGDIVEYGLQKRVLIATPPTLIGLLKVIRFGWNEERVAENASKISQTGKELHKRVCDFMEAFVDIGKHLDKAQSSYTIGLKRLESRVLVQAQRLEDLGAKGQKNLPS